MAEKLTRLNQPIRNGTWTSWELFAMPLSSLPVDFVVAEENVADSVFAEPDLDRATPSGGPREGKGLQVPLCTLDQDLKEFTLKAGVRPDEETTLRFQVKRKDSLFSSMRGGLANSSS
ncbi:hypothetical protein GGTG_04419 [Gaeumannomyces tritici R3-111a-1]|uniref:Uncharacterized protein n=1 Tax=Gaeumannomyces tritici (strain R3-111a-1) TaxID=644352 RepID=J3NT21_GAET3|nr:hypothetical protein GGTG_04419 [Gaeumannomyces tritici R3-111a-1]EJT79334.1 hypothetical protein GGTG_04419 [Gaeumannomyces tritici R3-111a-1]